MHVTLEGSFLCMSGAFVGILFSLGIVSFFTNFETVRVGDSTLAHSSTLQRIGVAACFLSMLLPVAVIGLAIVAFGLLINLDGFVPLIIDIRGDRLRRGWNIIGPLSQISHIHSHCEEGGVTMYVVFKDG